jgi:LacI family transcriptional regulator
MELQSKVRIKDIAERAGVSVGTVDRVIHGRTNVSKASLLKVQKVLDEINYVPNHYASALASNKTYNFAAILPMHEVDSYWARVENGLIDGLRRYQDFKITFKIFRYDPFNDDSFEAQAQQLVDSKPFAVIIGPIFSHGIMSKFIDRLTEMNTPYALIDSNWPEFHPVTFYGQDSVRSGEFAARITTMAAAGAKRIALFKIIGEGRVASRQQLDREAGFRRYMQEHSPKTEIVVLNLYAYDKEGMKELLREFFTNYPDIKYGLSFNSSIHKVAEFLRDEMPRHKRVSLLGYDAIDANVQCIKDGSVDFLIAQHPQKQGLNCLRTMVNACVLNMKQKVEHYVSIELLTKENIDFYKD